MEGLVNYSSEEEREESPKRNVAERCPAHAIDPYKRTKGDSSRRSKEESNRSSTGDRSQSSSSHREKDAHNSYRKNSHNEDSSWNRFNSGRDNYYRTDRRPAKSYDKRRDTKDDRKRRDGGRDGHRDRDYDHRDSDRDRRDRSDRYRRDRHDRERRRKSSDSPPPSSKDRSATSNRSRNRSRSRSPSKEYPSYSKTNAPQQAPETAVTDVKPTKSNDQRPITTIGYPTTSKIAPPPPPVVNLPLKEAPKMPVANSNPESAGMSLATIYNPNRNPESAGISPPTIYNPNRNPESAGISPPTIYNPNRNPESAGISPPTIYNPNRNPESAGISLPTYYNPNIINPTKYAEQVQKRKLIWGAKKSEDTAAKWGHATFSEDSDGKVASKFMRLMGIKSTPKVGPSAADTPSGEKTGPDVKSRQAMFSNMEQQYEVARQVTHTMRGVGLGFGSQSRQY